MTRLQASIAMKTKSIKQGRPQSPESGTTDGAFSTGSGGLKSSISKKNSGTIPTRGVEKSVNEN